MLGLKLLYFNKTGHSSQNGVCGEYQIGKSDSSLYTNKPTEVNPKQPAGHNFGNSSYYDFDTRSAIRFSEI